MIREITGLHHVTSMADDAQRNNAFFTKVLGLRRVKKTVNFDRPQVYHLYYGDEYGSAGTVMTYFPFPGMPRGRRGRGEVATTVFSVPRGSLGFWEKRLDAARVSGLSRIESFGDKRLLFDGPDGDGFALVESNDDNRAPWITDDIDSDTAVRGFHSASLRLSDNGAMSELLGFMGYEKVDSAQGVTRFGMQSGNGADFIDVETVPGAEDAHQGAGSVHHIAFAVPDRAAQLAVRSALMDTGYQVTPVIDRDYFWAIYFRTPGGVLFEVATDEPGFDRDEDVASLGEELRLPSQHEHLRADLEASLAPL